MYSPAMLSAWEQFLPFGSFVLLVALLHVCIGIQGRLQKSKIPTVGIRSAFEIGLISNFRFYKNAEAILAEGYAKVGYDLLLCSFACD